MQNDPENTGAPGLLKPPCPPHGKMGPSLPLPSPQAIWSTGDSHLLSAGLQASLGMWGRKVKVPQEGTKHGLASLPRHWTSLLGSLTKTLSKKDLAHGADTGA